MDLLDTFAAAHPMIAYFVIPVLGIVLNLVVRLLGQSHQPWATLLGTVLSALPLPKPPPPPALDAPKPEVKP